MRFPMLRPKFLAALVAVAICAAASPACAATVTHQYDLQPIGAPIEAGWTPIFSTTAATGSTPGMLVADEGGILPVHRNLDPSTEAPFDVKVDFLLGLSGPNVGLSDMEFREIIPENAIAVSMTIYRTDTADNFVPNFVTQMSINGGSPSVVPAPASPNGKYHAPILFSTALPLSDSIQTLDFSFFDNATNSSQVRINGFEFVYTVLNIPEPGTCALYGLSTLALAWHVRRRRRS